MLKRSNINLLPALALLFNSYCISAQVSPFNGLSVVDSLSEYKFIVSGHFHGQSDNVSTFPASTVLASVDTLNSIQPAFLISLGDLFLDVDEMYLRHYRNSLFNKLKFPLFNSVGNHDISNGNRYEKEFGKSYYSFSLSSELYIVLNTEENDGSIKDDQLNFLKGVLNSASLNEKVQNVFVFTHRPVWAERIDKYSKLFLENTRTAIGTNNFIEDVLPLLQNLKSKHIFWISGSMAGGPASFFYDKNDELGITFMQTAIRDTPRDAMLLVDIKEGNISFSGLSLTGQKLNPIESYGVDFWMKETKQEQPFSFRLIPLYLKNMLLHRYFWYGSVAALFILLCFRFLLKRRNK